MKVLWLCSTLIPEVSDIMGVRNSKPESWISGVYNRLKSNSETEIIYMYPTVGNISERTVENTTFISYSQKVVTKFECVQVEEYKKVIQKHTPDIVHIFGTEYPHTYAMVQACKELNMLDKVVVNIQGLVSIIAKHYYCFLPEKIVAGCTLRDLLKKDNVQNQRKKFEKRGEYEIAALKEAKNIIGRTDWDRACTERLNPNRKYYHCNETLRPAFYENQWDIDSCEKHSIFVSQCNYTIKGFHLMLEAMADVVEAYPDAHLYTTGYNPLSGGFKQRLKQTYYAKYLGKLIKKFGLEKHVTFLGPLNEKEMCDRFLKSHVFVNCSSIENSPNSVGEAMILGVPTVSSDVGGVKNMLDHNKEGFVYQPDAPYMAAHYIKRIFENDDLARELSGNARKHAEITHNSEENYLTLMSIYSKICEKGI